MEKGPAEPFFSFWAGLEGLLLRLRPGTHQVSKALIRFSARSITVVSTDGTDSTDVMYRPHVQMVVDGPGAGALTGYGVIPTDELYTNIGHVGPGCGVTHESYET